MKKMEKSPHLAAVRGLVADAAGQRGPRGPAVGAVLNRAAARAPEREAREPRHELVLAVAVHGSSVVDGFEGEDLLDCGSRGILGNGNGVGRKIGAEWDLFGLFLGDRFDEDDDARGIWRR